MTNKTARVRTLDEARNLPDDAVSYYEIRKGSTIDSLQKKGIPFGLLIAYMWPEEYNIEWRVWDGKPNKKIRDATQWL